MANERTTRTLVMTRLLDDAECEVDATDEVEGSALTASRVLRAFQSQ
jgi:hypothetical protein